MHFSKNNLEPISEVLVIINYVGTVLKLVRSPLNGCRTASLKSWEHYLNCSYSRVIPFFTSRTLKAVPNQTNVNWWLWTSFS